MYAASERDAHKVVSAPQNSADKFNSSASNAAASNAGSSYVLNPIPRSLQQRECNNDVRQVRSLRPAHAEDVQTLWRRLLHDP